MGRVHGKNESDSFWDTKWEAMELQKKADIHEKKGKHFLADEFKRKAAKDKRDSTPSLSPENRSPSPECDELKRINKIKDIQGLIVQESEKYVAEPQDPNLFKYDENTKMWRRKMEKEINDGIEVKALTYEQNETNDNKEEVGAEVECTSGLENNATSISDKLSSEEIDEIRKKREKYKGTKESII